MQTTFLRALERDGDLAANERRVLSQLSIRSADELLSFLWSFPAVIREMELDGPKLSNAAAGRAEGFLATMVDENIDPRRPPSVALGAVAPNEASWQVGSRLAVGDVGVAEADQQLLDRAQISKRPSSGWPVKDQGRRGTCVAFALTALVEHLEGLGQEGVLFSEQFLFWATKTQTADPQPSTDGTWIEFAVAALAGSGICLASAWPYNGTPIAGDVAQACLGPTPAAVLDAGSRRHRGAVYGRPRRREGAAAVLEALQACRPVAVSLPVFADPLLPQGNNWNSPVGRLYGRVLNPPPTSVVVGGHAVAIVGFVGDANDPLGGSFIIRNSWGPALFGSRLPNPSYAGPEPGYGEVSASYVNDYLWEMAQL